MKIKHNFSSAFTIVELMVIIVVVGILVGVTTVGYGSWQDSVARKAVQSDLQMAGAAMENAKNFSAGYPTNGTIPSTFKASSSVSVTYYSGDATTFCIDGVSTTRPDIHYFIDSSIGKQPLIGTCEFGEEVQGVLAWKPTMSASQDHICAVATNSNAYCWGLGTNGRLGNNGTASSSVPVAVTMSGALAGKAIKSISAGSTHTCAVASDNNAYCWGLGSSGQLGHNSTSSSSVPVAVNTSGALSGKTIKSISAGSGFTCAIASDNNAYCWGYNVYGALGTNYGGNSLVPVAVDTSGALAGKTIKLVSAGSNFICAIASDNNAYCWGYSNYGQLGDGTTTTSPVPVAVATSGALSGKTLKTLDSGISHSCAVASDNNAYCWGYGLYGRLGYGSASSSSVPVPVTNTGVLAGKSLKSIAAGSTHTCTLTTENKAYCWGQNTSGRLGDGTTNMSSVPVSVSTSGEVAGKTIKQISTKGNYTCAVASDNNAYCWGENASGQFGKGNTNSSNVPTIVNTP